MRMSTLQVAAISLAASSMAFAQAAPRENPSAEVGGKKVAVEYGKPALGDRSLDDLLKKLPEDGVWRAGSEQVTTFETEGDVLIGGEKVSAGKYSLYVQIGEDGSRSLLVNSVLGQPLGDVWAEAPENMKQAPWPHFAYAKEIADKEVARVPLEKSSLDAKQDLFTIALSPADGGATLNMSWGMESWSAAVTPAK